MSIKEEIIDENNANVYIDALIKELEMFVDYTLIPGDIQPAIYWLSLYPTIELKLILKKLYKKFKICGKNIQDLDRISTMKEILLNYYPDCHALKDNCKPSLSN